MFIGQKVNPIYMEKAHRDHCPEIQHWNRRIWRPFERSNTRSRTNLKGVDWDGEDSYLDALKSHSLFTSAANIHFLADDDFWEFQKDRDSSETTNTKQENFAEDLLQTATPEHFDGPWLRARSHSPHGSRSHYGSHSQYGCGSKMGIFNLLTFLVYGFSLFVTLLSSTTLGNLLANILNANIVNINTNTNTNTNENMNMNMNMNMNGRAFRFLAGVDAYASSFDDGRGREAKRSTSNLVNGSKIRNKFPTHVERFLGANLLVVFLQLTGRTPSVRPFCSIQSLD
ncbi:uncharacterized protein LOC135197518 [Macrobrachium nipponense]|uniref:uncharacterized protein LOC135197518 n=1 Tax=Macrobrachium nipponense TaxID=159736 RepID=UPI0030C87BF6